MIQRARAFWIARPGTGEIREEPLPRPTASQVLVRALYSGVSRGTESIVFQGRVPASEHDRMRCPHQAGSFPGPVKYGYSSVGSVVEGPEPWLGRSVFCLFPHQSAYVVEQDAVVLLPDGVPPGRAVLAANMETAINALWDAEPLLGDRVSIVGAGVVGCLCAYLLGRIPGVEVELVDVNPGRARIAAALGVGFANADSATGDRDLVLHASGTAAGLRAALELAAQDATIVELSWFGDTDVALPLGQSFHVRRLTLRSTQVGTLSPRARRRHSHRSRLEMALALCRDTALDTLIDGDSSLFDLPAVMAELSASGGGPLCRRIHYPESVESLPPPPPGGAQSY
jgi:NADPH:quinone reductase-like Zn-dependent oxidoreductase